MYAFTVKYNCGKPEDVIENDYDRWIHHAYQKKSCCLDKLTYERDKLGRLHLHGIIVFPSVTFFRKKLMLHGYHVYFEEIWNYVGWEEYLSKQHSRTIFRTHMDQLSPDESPPPFSKKISSKGDIGGFEQIEQLMAEL